MSGRRMAAAGIAAGLVVSACAVGFSANGVHAIRKIPNQVAGGKSEPAQVASRNIYDENADGRALIRAALAAAEMEEKLVLITWGANWCGWCHQLEAIFRNDPAVRKVIDDHYVRVIIDVGHRNKHMDLAREYGIDFDNTFISFTTLHNAKGKLIAELPVAAFCEGAEGSRDYSPARIATVLERYAPTVNDPPPTSYARRSAQDPYDETADGTRQLSDALERAKEQNKNVLVVWGANWCGWCHRLAAVFENDAKLREVVDDNFVKISIDVGKRNKNMDLALALGQDMDNLSIPHMTVLNPERKLIGAMQSRVCGVGPAGERKYSGEKLAEVLLLHAPRE